MTGVELVSALADAQVREQVQRLLGLPTDRVAERLDVLALAQTRTENAVHALAAEVRELSAEVKTLAAAQARTEEAVKTLAAAQARTDESLKALAAAQARTEEAVKTLAAAQARTEEAVKELARVGKETRQAVAALADNVGFGLEELAALVLPDVLRQRRGVSVARFRRRFFTTAQGEEEIDLFGEADRGGEQVVVVGEVKSRIYRAEVEHFARRVERIRDQIDRPLVPVMFGFVVHPSAVAPAEAAGILLVASRPSSAAA
jgi:hypothetical protein